MDESMTRKLVLVPVCESTLRALFTKGNRILLECVEGLPPEAELRHISYDSQIDRFYLCYSHDSFEEVPFGEVLPKLEILFQSIPEPQNDPALQEP